MQQITIPYHITRTYIQEHSDWIFLYGHDYLGKGFFGQCNSAHNEPNSFPIPTLYKYCSNPVYFQDASFYSNQTMILSKLKNIPKDKIIIPFPKIGKGCSRMPEMCPRLFSCLMEALNQIAYPNIKIDWTFEI